MTKQEIIAPGALTRREWAKRISVRWEDACEGMAQAIFDIGDWLLKAKNGEGAGKEGKLPHGEFMEMVDNDLPFPYKTAQRFMVVASDKRLRKWTQLSNLPPHYMTLHKMTALSDPVLKKLIADGVINPTCDFAEINRVLRLERVAADEANVRKLKPRPGKYRTLVIDPAWDYDNLSLAARAKADYAKQTLESLRMLDLTQWAEPQCHLYCWATNNYLHEALDLVRHWGFQYRLTLAWVKRGDTGKTQIGLGSYFRHAWEPCIFATLGDTTTTEEAAKIATVIYAPRGKQHSEKPKEFYDLVRKASYPPFGEGNQRPRPWNKDFESIFQIGEPQVEAAE